VIEAVNGSIRALLRRGLGGRDRKPDGDPKGLITATGQDGGTNPSWETPEEGSRDLPLSGTAELNGLDAEGYFAKVLTGIADPG
jgi:hypothetical protein